MKKCLFPVAGLLILAALVVGYSRRTAVNPDPNHTHADFAVVVLGHKLDFSDARYMSGLSTDDTTHDEEGEYHHEYLHLHDGNGNVMHRHKPGLSIGDFVTSLGFSMTKDCFTLDDQQFAMVPAEGRNSYGLTKKLCNNGKFRWQMFVNKKEVSFDPAYAFRDLDRILLTYNAADMDLANFDTWVTEDACMYSKTCPWRGNPPTENCIADPTIPCVVQ